MPVHTPFGQQCVQLRALSRGSDHEAFFALARQLFRPLTPEEWEDLGTLCFSGYDVDVTQALLRYSETDPQLATELLVRGNPALYNKWIGHIRDSTLRGEREFARTGATPPAVTAAEACVEKLLDPEIADDGWIYAFLDYHNILCTHGTVGMTSKIMEGLCATQWRVCDCMTKISKDTPQVIVVGVFKAAYYVSQEALQALDAAEVAKDAKAAEAGQASEAEKAPDERVSLDATMVKAYAKAHEKVKDEEYYDQDAFCVSEFWHNAQLYSPEMAALTPKEFRTQESSDDEEEDVDPDDLSDDDKDEKDDERPSKRARV